MNLRSLAACAFGVAALSGCTLVSVGSGGDGPPRVESNGLIEGHAALGIRDEDDFLRVKLLDGESEGALGEIVIWKLFRLEVGALGLGVGVGPFDLALGTLFYEPKVPRMQGKDKDHASESTSTSEVEDCPICAKAKADAKARAEAEAQAKKD